MPKEQKTTKGQWVSLPKLAKTVDLVAANLNGFMDETRRGFEDMRRSFQVVGDDIRLIRSDLADVKTTVRSLVVEDAHAGREIGELRRRVERLEKHTGLDR